MRKHKNEISINADAGMRRTMETHIIPDIKKIFFMSELNERSATLKGYSLYKKLGFEEYQTLYVPMRFNL